MASNPKTFILQIYVDRNKNSAFDAWLRQLDKKVVARIEARISRFKLGNFGDHKKIKSAPGLWEARFTFGKGYRLYFGKEAGRIVLLLAGGDKSSQEKDIKVAHGYLEDWRNQNG